MKIKGCILLAAILGLAGQGVAEDAESPERDMGIRIALGVSPGVSESEFMGRTYAVDEDSGGQLEILFARRHWSENNPDFAWIWGAGVFFAGMSGTAEQGSISFPPGTEYDLSAFGFLGQGGVALRAGKIVILEFQPYLGVGGAVLDVGYDEGGAGYAVFGVKGGAFFDLGERVELGLEVGYQANAAEAEVALFGGGTADLNLTGDGLHAAAVLSIKL